jgi:hypothetical protein
MADIPRRICQLVVFVDKRSPLGDEHWGKKLNKSQNLSKKEAGLPRERIIGEG